MLTLREDQNDAIELLRSSFTRGNKRIVMQAPTGFGKTLLAAQLVQNARAKNKRVLFMVPAIALIDQTVESFFRQGITEIGVIQAQHPMTDWSQPVQVASVQTLNRRKKWPADLVIIDEVHKWFDFYGKWMKEEDWQKIPFIGLSATPWRKGLGEFFTDLIAPTTTQELIDKGLLSPFRVFAPNHPDLSDVRTVAGDYVVDDLSKVMNDNVLVADIVNTWLAKAERRPTLCFAVDRDHARILQDRFLAAGVPTAYQDAYTTDDDRKQIKADFHSGKVEVVCNVGTLTTGVDWDVRCIILARPTKSEMLFVQIIGRGLRTAVGKDYCLILDHSDTHLRLGFVTDIDVRKKEQGLDDGKQQKKENKSEQDVALPKECVVCGCLRQPGSSKCANCGYEAKHVVRADEKLKEGKGELKELKQQKLLTTADKLIFLSELKGYATSKNYKEGWAYNKYREKFGVFPDNTVRDARPADPSMKTLNWIKSRQIAWANSKRNRAA